MVAFRPFRRWHEAFAAAASDVQDRIGMIARTPEGHVSIRVARSAPANLFSAPLVELRFDPTALDPVVAAGMVRMAVLCVPSAEGRAA